MPQKRHRKDCHDLNNRKFKCLNCNAMPNIAAISDEIHWLNHESLGSSTNGPSLSNTCSSPTPSPTPSPSPLHSFSAKWQIAHKIGFFIKTSSSLSRFCLRNAIYRNCELHCPPGFKEIQYICISMLCDIKLFCCCGYFF